MDALSDVLRAADLGGGVFLNAEFSEPWCISVQVGSKLCAPFMGPRRHILPYHYIVEGELDVRVGQGADKSGETISLRSGECILFPRNEPHVMGSDLALTPTPSSEIIHPPEGVGLYAIRHGGGGRRARMICGFIGFDKLQGNPVMSSLPPAMKIEAGTGATDEWVRSTFHYAAEEVGTGRAGSEIVLVKLAELLFVRAVRKHVEQLPAGQTGWLAGLRDPFVARALALIHGDPARDWTLDALGAGSGLSRSALGERFTRLLGLAPIGYLTNWRMQIAARELKESHASLGKIAEMTGYASEAAFSRAFKKAFGAAPATWRRGE